MVEILFTGVVSKLATAAAEVPPNALALANEDLIKLLKFPVNAAVPETNAAEVNVVSPAAPHICPVLALAGAVLVV
jgi:hypothetical protein